MLSLQDAHFITFDEDPDVFLDDVDEDDDVFAVEPIWQKNEDIIPVWNKLQAYFEDAHIHTFSEKLATINLVQEDLMISDTVASDLTPSEPPPILF